MKKLIALMLSALMLFALLTAAGAETVAPAHLNIWLAGNGEAESNEAFHKIFDAWVAERSPGSTYELSFIAWSDYFTKLSTALASGEGPDVFMTGYGQLGTIVSQGHTANLSEKIPADWDGWSDIPENLLNAGKKDGNVYGILEPATRLYYVNKEYASYAGVAEEELEVNSLDDLAALAKKLTIYDGNNVQVSGLHILNEPSIDYIEQMVQSIALNFDPDFHMWNADGTANFNGEAGVKAVQWMKDQLAEGYNFPSEQGFDQFSNGLCSLYLMAESSYATYANTLGQENTGILKSSLNTLLIGNFITVNAASKNIDTAVDCLMYMFNPESLKIKASLGMFPNRVSLYDWYKTEYPNLAEVPNYFEHSYAYSDTLIPFFTQGIQVFRTAAGEALNTDTDVKAALDAGAEAWNALIK